MLDDAVWPELAERAATSVLVVPLGSTEQHGPHLPFGTDTGIAVALVERVAARRDDVVVAPALAYGSSGEHAAFPGTLSIGAAALELVVLELVRSADAFAGVVLVSGHGGNAAPLAAASATAASEGREVLVWFPRIAGGDAHAGRTETSMMLALRPGAVRPQPWETGDARPLAELMPALVQAGVAAVAPNGILGDPRGASADEGRAIIEQLVDDLDRAIETWKGARR